MANMANMAAYPSTSTVFTAVAAWYAAIFILNAWRARRKVCKLSS